MLCVGHCVVSAPLMQPSGSRAGHHVIVVWCRFFWHEQGPADTTTCSFHGA